MLACSRDLQGAATTLLAADVCEVGAGGEGNGVFRGCRRQDVGVAAQIRDRLREVAHRERLDPGERRLGCGRRRAQDPREPGPRRSFGGGDRADHGSHAAVERKLADAGVLQEALGRYLPRRGEERERDGQVEASTLLAERRRREVDGDPRLLRPLEQRRRDAAADAMLGLLAGAVGETDDRECRYPARQVHLDLDTPGVEADQREGDGAPDHPPTLRLQP